VLLSYACIRVTQPLQKELQIPKLTYFINMFSMLYYEIEVAESISSDRFTTSRV